MTFWKWSKTASSNGTADSSCPFPEGMAPSALNDGTRGMMAALSKYRDDISGAIATGGTSTAYTVASNQGFDTLPHLDTMMIAFTPHTTNGATVTLNVDSLGAKPLRSAPGVELPAGAIIQGTPYLALYSNTDGAFYLHGFFGNPYGIPIAASVDFWGSTAPNSSFVLAYGQPISRATYSVLFGLLGTTYGSGDGSTTFNIPDCRGRIVAGKDDMGGSAASRLTSTYFGTAATALGNSGGSDHGTLAANQIPAGVSSTGSNSISVTANRNIPSTTGTIGNQPTPSSGGNPTPNTSAGAPGDWQTQPSFSGSNSITVTSVNASQQGVALIQPTIIANKLIRII